MTHWQCSKPLIPTVSIRPICKRNVWAEDPRVCCRGCRPQVSPPYSPLPPAPTSQPLTIYTRMASLSTPICSASGAYHLSSLPTVWLSCFLFGLVQAWDMLCYGTLFPAWITFDARMISARALSSISSIATNFLTLPAIVCNPRQLPSCTHI
jgi:hypothetical protein